MKKLFISICIILIGVISNANGQFYSGGWTLGPNWAYNRAMNDIEIAKLAMQGNIYNRMLAENRNKPRAKKKIASGITAFKSNQRYLLPTVFAENFKGSANEKKQLKASLEQAIKGYEYDALRFGYPANDLSFALTHHFYNNYSVYKAIIPMWKNSKGQMQYNVSKHSVYSRQVSKSYIQFRTFLTKKEGLKKMSNDDKQKMAEYLAISTNLIYQAYADVEPKLNNNMKQVAGIRHNARKNLEKLLGVSVNKIGFGDNGIFIKK